MIVLNLGLLHLCPVRAVLARVPLGPALAGPSWRKKAVRGATAPKAASHDRWKSALTLFLATYFGSGLRGTDICVILLKSRSTISEPDRDRKLKHIGSLRFRFGGMSPMRRPGGKVSLPSHGRYRLDR